MYYVPTFVPQTTMKRIRVAVVGLGYWGPNLARNFIKIPGVELGVLCDQDQKKLNDVASAYPTAKKTTSFTALLKDPELEFIAIATPLSTHFSLAKQALMTKKHVLLEKPMTKTSAQARELIALAKKNRLLLAVGYTFVYTSAVRYIKNLLQKKVLGRIFYYDSTRINLGILQPDTNVIWDLAVHDFSILNHIFPEKTLSLRAFASTHVRTTFEEMAHLIITYEHNVTAHIHVSWLSPVKIRRILIGGSKKMVTYDDIEPSEKIRIYDDSVRVSPASVTPFAPAYRSGNAMIPHLDQTEALYRELSHFVTCIRKHTTPETDGVQGLKVVEMLEAADRAVQTKSEVSLI